MLRTNKPAVKCPSGKFQITLLSKLKPGLLAKTMTTLVLARSRGIIGHMDTEGDGGEERLIGAMVEAEAEVEAEVEVVEVEEEEVEVEEEEVVVVHRITMRAGVRMVIRSSGSVHTAHTTHPRLSPATLPRA